MFDLNQVSANAAGLCHETIMFEHERSYERNRPFMRYGARVYQDGAAFCCCLGEFGPDCICGFGDTPDEACRKFDKAWYATAKQPAAEPVPAPMLPGESARDAFIRQTGMGDGNHD